MGRARRTPQMSRAWEILGKSEKSGRHPIGSRIGKGQMYTQMHGYIWGGWGRGVRVQVGVW